MPDNPKWTDKAIVFFTLCLVAVAIWQGVIFHHQWKEMHSGGADTHDLALAAQLQAEAAKAQADEAKAEVSKLGESLEKTDKLIQQATMQAKATQTLAVNSKANLGVTRDSEQLAERAWIGIQIEVLSAYALGKPISATVTLSNTGRSPALRISYTANLAVLDKGEKPNFLLDWQLNDWSGVQPIPPQGGYQIVASRNRPVLYGDEKEKIDHQQKIVWVYGSVEYEDIFGKSHDTRFCGYTFDVTSTDPMRQGELLKSCPEYSDMN